MAMCEALVEFRTYDDLDTYTCVADHGIGIIIKDQIEVF